MGHELPKEVHAGRVRCSFDSSRMDAVDAGSLRASFPILIWMLDEVKLWIGSNPNQFALAHDALRRNPRALNGHCVSVTS